MDIAVNHSMSSWRPVMSGALQDTLLGQGLFDTFISNTDRGDQVHFSANLQMI